jgi:hypothetical protein
MLMAMMTAGCATPALPRLSWPMTLPWPSARQEPLIPIAPLEAVSPRDVFFGRDVKLTLPLRPGYPGPFEASQTVVARHEGRTVAFQAALAFSEAEARVTLVAPSGPRILSLAWTEDGITEERTMLAPDQLRGVDVLADIFLCLWPAEMVRTALGSGAAIDVTGAVRTIRTADRVVAEISEEPLAEGATRHVLRNLDRGYSLTIVTQRVP